MASSGARAVARTSVRLATFATAMSSTSPAAAANSPSVVRALPTISARSGKGVRRAVLSWNPDAQRGKMRSLTPARSRFAASSVTPSLSRANTKRPNGPRRFGVSSCSAGHTSTLRPASGKEPVGMTPITVCAVPLIVSVRPTAAAAPPSEDAA